MADAVGAPTGELGTRALAWHIASGGGNERTGGATVAGRTPGDLVCLSATVVRRG